VTGGEVYPQIAQIFADFFHTEYDFEILYILPRAIENNGAEETGYER